jgi:PleD family two-component response regulator
MAEHSILLLDPFTNLLSTFQLILEQEDYLVETATTTEEALNRLSLRSYSVLIMEYIPPIEDTCRLIQWLRHTAPETYILMVTQADINETTYETLFEIGLDDLVLKPYPPDKILAHIKKGIRQRDFILETQEVERQSLLDRVAQQIQRPIFNPAYFRKCLRQELKRARRHRHPLSLLLLRIPPEQILGGQLEQFCVELAKLLRNHTREEDLVGRENGNFGVLLPETDLAGSGAVVKRLTDLIQRHPAFDSDDFLKSVSDALSFQCFTYPERFVVPESLRDVLEEVDRQYTRT